MNGVRFREDTFEGQCGYCREWWDITLEFWSPVHGLRMCRACHNIYKRLKQAERRTDPVKREKDRQAVYAMRDALSKAGIMGEYRRAWYVRNREAILVARRERYAAERAAAGKPYTPRIEVPDDHVLVKMRGRKAA